MDGSFGSVEYILDQLGLNSTHQKRSRENPPSRRVEPAPTPRAGGRPEPFIDRRHDKLELALGRKGVVLSREKCRLICLALEDARAFAASGRKVLVRTDHGTVRTTNVGGVLVLEFVVNGPGRPLRMTREKTALVLECVASIRAFAARQ
jgi:hypothetical protein